MSYVFLLVMLAFTGCASREIASTPTPEQDRERMKGLSSIQIDYIRGSNHHRFIATANLESALVELFSDTKLLRQGKIDREKFHLLAQEAQQLLQTPMLQSMAACRTPFVLKITSDAETKKVEGCRSADEGAAVGRLIRQAEFLVHSQD